MVYALNPGVKTVLKWIAVPRHHHGQPSLPTVCDTGVIRDHDRILKHNGTIMEALTGNVLRLSLCLCKLLLPLIQIDTRLMGRLFRFTPVLCGAVDHPSPLKVIACRFRD